MTLTTSKIRVTWFFLKSSGTFLFILGLSIWFGSLIFFGFGVAPVNFNIAEAWELTGINPQMPKQNVVYQTVAGALTGTSIQRLNILEITSAFMMAVGIMLLWIPRNNQSRWLLAETITLFFSITLLAYYMFYVGDRLFEIQQTIPVDFSITKDAAKSAAHLEFDRLHNLYTTLTKINLFLLLLQFIFFTFQISSNRVNRLLFSGPPRVHYEVVERS